MANMLLVMVLIAQYLILTCKSYSKQSSKCIGWIVDSLDLIPLDLFDGHFSSTTTKCDFIYIPLIAIYRSFDLFMVIPVNFVRVPIFRLKPFCNWRCFFGRFHLRKRWLVVAILLMICFHFMIHITSLSCENEVAEDDSTVWKINPKQVDALRSKNVHFPSRLREKKRRIGIVTIVDNNTTRETLEYAMSTVACYARIQRYDYRIIDDDAIYQDQCPQTKREFRRHCIVKRILMQYNYILFLIADIGVVNPRRRIEEFIDKKADIVLYERFHVIELMAGSYLVRNSRWTLDFLDRWANYEKWLPRSFHGSDSGALYFLLAESLLPDRKIETAVCRQIWSKSRNYADLFATLSCVRNIIGETTHNGRVKVLQKGTSWARDSFVTKGRWCPTKDFMLSDMRPKLRLNPIPLKIVRLSDMTHTYSWYGQLAGKIEIHRCHPRNSTWRYARPLIIHSSLLEERFVLFHQAIHYVKMLAMTRTPQFVRGMSRKPEKYVFKFTGWADG